VRRQQTKRSGLLRQRCPRALSPFVATTFCFEPLMGAANRLCDVNRRKPEEYSFGGACLVALRGSRATAKLASSFVEKATDECLRIGLVRGRVARPFGFALTDPDRRFSRIRLFPEVSRVMPHVVSMGE
jgi:hypothetical protein